jgi:hypothetical protein
MAKRWMLLPVLAICFEPGAAFADPIRIMSGDLIGDQNGAVVTLASTGRGFSLVASGDSTGGVWSPGRCDGDCLPGTEQSLTARWSGSDFLGTATVDGRTFDVGIGSEFQAAASVDFEGSWTAPALTDRTTATVVSPFTFDGFFVFPFTVDQPPELELVGSGIATLQLSQSPGIGGWEFVSATYRFSDQPPVPEPASLLLVGVGLGGVIARRMRRPA